MAVLRNHLEGATLEVVPQCIPKETGWVWRTLPFFEKQRGKNMSIPDEEKGLKLHLLAAVQEIVERPAVLSDLRLESRRYLDEKKSNRHFCPKFSEPELHRHFAGTMDSGSVWVPGPGFLPQRLLSARLYVQGAFMRTRSHTSRMHKEHSCVHKVILDREAHSPT
ncbi:hypothetical protein IWZ00DRAFT_496362 [Phyllosticta capitalensis]